MVNPTYIELEIYEKPARQLTEIFIQYFFLLFAFSAKTEEFISSVQNGLFKMSKVAAAGIDQ